MTSNNSGYVCIVGVGFVGESLLREFSHVHPTMGFDISENRIKDLRSKYADQKDLVLTTNEADLKKANHYLISVPTLLKADHSVDFSHLKSALSTVFRYARPGNTIVIESSVSVGTTRQLFQSTQNVFHCGMSPERVDPGRTVPAANEIPKVISGLTPESLNVITDLYSSVFNHVVPVSCPEVAEMCKLFENCYRMINIAYVNEISDACRNLGINPNEVIDAASTKPYGFQTFRPGLGVGGHCIPVNPSYLMVTCPNLPVLDQSTTLMRERPRKLARELHGHISSSKLGSTNLKPRVLVIGLGFKPGQSVLSHSPGIDFATELQRLGCDRLAFYDPLVAQHALPLMEKLEDDSFNPNELAADFDAVVICCRQHGVDFDVLDQLPSEMVWSYD
ncbi:UDP-N-acetyl-D-glucosamine 6-dehydrogenase [Exophiala dermatitidis]